MPKNPHANFSPTLEGYSGQEAFRFWCQMALPLTYDDSLSYYELLNKVVTYLNNTISDVANVETNVDSLSEAYNQLQKYVNDYFDDLDIEAELRNVLDAMALDGTLDELLDPIVADRLPNVVGEQIGDVVASQIDDVVEEQLPPLVSEGIPDEVTDWLNENVTPVGSAVIVDDSLTIEGAAADAKKTGDELTDLKSALDNVSDKITDGVYPFAVADKDGKAALIIDVNGYIQAKQKYFKADENGIYSTDANGNDLAELNGKSLFDFAVCDKNGHISFYVNDGKLVVPSADIKGIDNPDIDSIKAQILQNKREKEAIFDAELNMFIAYGQSWSVGYDATAITLTPMYDNIMFDTGIKNNPLSDMAQTPTSFVPMVEFTGANANPQTMICGETPVSAMCRMVKQLIEDENGYAYTDFPYQLLGNAPGYGDKTLAELAKGSTYYDRLIDQVEIAYNIASSLGKKLVVQAFSWQQLEKGSISGTYAENLEQLRADVDADVKAITGQTQTVKCITWQTFNRSATGAADCYNKYVGASETYPNIICSGASYQFRHVASDNLHLIATDNDWAGAYFGLAYKRTIIDGEKFVPLKPTKAERYNNVCILTFNVPVKPLVFDTDTVESVSNMGFNLLTSGGDEKTITRVEIIAPDKIKITAGASIDSTDRITYGQNAGTAFGPVNGNRGNVRDSQGNNIKCYAGDGATIALHNWLVIFDKTINNMED